MEMKSERSKAIAAFMAFGTKGDVYPIAAIASAFASHHNNYQLYFITHTAHHHLAPHLAQINVKFTPVSSPPIVSPPSTHDTDGSLSLSFSNLKRTVTREHRRECLSVMEMIFENAPSMKGDFVLINFFALEGWSLAELFQVRCVVASPYAVHYTAPSSFERQFRQELPLLYQYLKQAPVDKLGWKDVLHWMWPLFSQDWGLWRRDELNLSSWPLTDPVTELPLWHERPPSPLLLYGFSREVVECPDYWPSNTRVCGFWFLPSKWQFSCSSCYDSFELGGEFCLAHTSLLQFLSRHTSTPLIFVGLSSLGNMGFLSNPKAFLCILRCALKITSCRFLLFTAGYEPLDVEVGAFAAEENLSISGKDVNQDDGISLFNERLFCCTGSIPYSWVFEKCAVAVHHGGSGTTAVALKAGIPQVSCPCMLDQFYWAERMFWVGVGAEPLKRKHLLPENCDDLSLQEGANMLSAAIKYALRPEIKARALEVSTKICAEDGVLEAIRILQEELL